MRLLPTVQQISLRDIHGAELPFVWLQIERSLVVDERLPTVLIVGSAIELNERTVPIVDAGALDEYCQGIATTLARLGFNIVSDGCPGIPDRIESYFASQPVRGISLALSVLRGPDEHQTDRAYSPTGFPVSGDIRLFCGTGFEMLSILNTYSADLVLVVGGGLGSLMEGAIAVINDLPVVCFSPAGGISGEMQALFERYRSQYKNLQIATCETMADLVLFLEGFAGDFQRRREHSRLHGLLSRLQLGDDASQAGTDIVVDANLLHVTYQCNHHQIQIRNPTLLIDDMGILSDAGSGVAVRGHLESTSRRYHFEGITVHVPARMPGQVWCPSIDTFFLINSMRSRLRQAYANTLDIGTGTGAIALWLASHGGIGKVLGIDPNAEATRCAAVNVVAAGLAGTCRVETTTYQDLDLSDQRFDLITCTPPYVPRLQEGDQPDGSFAGVSLIVDLLSTIDEVLAAGGECYMTLSSVSWLDAKVRSQMQARIDRGMATLVAERKVPFKLTDVLLDVAWLGKLTERGHVFQCEEDCYEYWHRVQVWRLTGIA